MKLTRKITVKKIIIIIQTIIIIVLLFHFDYQSKKDKEMIDMLNAQVGSLRQHIDKMNEENLYK